VRADGASDFNTMMRLKAFLEGKADSRQEVHGMITLEDMQARCICRRSFACQTALLLPSYGNESRTDKCTIKGRVDHQRSSHEQ